eukprot:8510650-Alexandrium_andersonii.AAC.1
MCIRDRSLSARSGSEGIVPLRICFSVYHPWTQVKPARAIPERLQRHGLGHTSGRDNFLWNGRSVGAVLCDRDFLLWSGRSAGA